MEKIRASIKTVCTTSINKFNIVTFIYIYIYIYIYSLFTATNLTLKVATFFKPANLVLRSLLTDIGNH